MIQLWAELKTALRSRDNWLKNDPDSRIGARDLIDSLAASRRGRALADSVRLEVHEVREYRNSPMRDRDEPTRSVAPSDARRRLNSYLRGKLSERSP